jgi:hypothetical protein
MLGSHSGSGLTGVDAAFGCALTGPKAYNHYQCRDQRKNYQWCEASLK